MVWDFKNNPHINHTEEEEITEERQEGYSQCRDLLDIVITLRIHNERPGLKVRALRTGYWGTGLGCRHRHKIIGNKMFLDSFH